MRFYLFIFEQKKIVQQREGGMSEKEVETAMKNMFHWTAFKGKRKRPEKIYHAIMRYDRPLYFNIVRTNSHTIFGIDLDHKELCGIVFKATGNDRRTMQRAIGSYFRLVILAGVFEGYDDAAVRKARDKAILTNPEEMAKWTRLVDCLRKIVDRKDVWKAIKQIPLDVAFLHGIKEQCDKITFLGDLTIFD